MGRLRQLSEAVLKAVGTPDLQQTRAYRQALRFLRAGILPSGQRYGDGPPRLIVLLGGAESCEVVRLRQAAQEDGTVRFEARFAVRPSREGGAGVSIDGALTEVFISQAEGAPCDDAARIALAAALRAVCEERLGSVREAFARILTPEDCVWRLVGWPQRDAWMLVDAPIVERVALGDAWVEQTRGETWPARNWEAWVPVTLDIVARLRRR